MASVLQKSWYSITPPEMFDVDEVGQTPAENPSQVKGRTVKEPVNDLLEPAEKYYMSVEFQVTEVEGNKAFTKISGLECSSEFVSRLVRPGSDRLDVVTDLETVDGEQVRLKLVGATNKNTSSERITQLRNAAEEELRTIVSDTRYQDLMESVLLNELQEEVREKLEEIYPLRELEVRKAELQE